MASPVNRLFLLDGMALVYRAHFALIRNPRLTSTGMNTSAAFVYTNMLLEIIDKGRPTHLAAVFDTPEPTHRHELFEEYKAHREAMPEELSAALPYVFRLCEAFRVPVIREPGYEADDVIGTLARIAEAEGFETYMVTPDKDYAQLVSDRTFIYKPGRSGSGAEILGVPEVLKKWQIERVEQVVDILALWGDTSDNIPGVPGVGEKTAQKLIAQFGSVEGLLAHCDELKGKLKEKVDTHRTQAMLAKKLVTIVRDVPLDISLADLKRREPDREKLAALFAELEFRTLGARVLGEEFSAGLQRAGAATPQTQEGEQEEPTGDDATTSTESPAEIRTIADVTHEYRAIDTAQGRAELIERLQRQPCVCFDVETTGLNPRTCEIVGLAFSYEPRSGYYVPIPDDQEEARAILAEFQPLFENPDVEKVGHNLKFDLSVLKWHGIEVSGPFFDTMLAAFLAEPDLRRTLDYLSEALLGYRPISITELIGERGDDQGNMRDVPLDKVTEYAVEDADIALQLRELLKPRLTETNQDRIFYEIECPLLPALVAMEYEGIRIDVDALKRLSAQLSQEIERTTARIYELAGGEFNLNSPRQLGQILFEKLKLEPNARRTQKTGQYSTNERVLTQLAGRHEIVRLVLDHRALTKLKSTYVDMLPGAVFARTGRVHTTYEQAVTVTGRMQSHNPNLQNIPIRTERGREIRQAFVARNEEYTLLSADYSQIELRIAAELSQDATMLEAFIKGEDIHRTTATTVYGVSSEDVTDEMRQKAKAVNFSIIYGISPFGLAQRLNISRAEATDLIEQYFRTYPGMKRYMEETIAFAKEHGYVETMFGRRRYLRDINSRNATTRRAAERNAINSRVQGTAADMIKIAMSRIYEELVRRNLRTKMLLQIHDELVFDMHRDEAEVVMPLVKEKMTTAIPMRVPIVVEMGTGDNWLEAH